MLLEGVSKSSFQNSTPDTEAWTTLQLWLLLFLPGLHVMNTNTANYNKTLRTYLGQLLL
jgi:hypothetical protein